MSTGANTDEISLSNLNLEVKYYVVVTMIILEKGSMVVSINGEVEILTAIIVKDDCSTL